MRKLLNTLYVTSENSYLSLDGENVSSHSDTEGPFPHLWEPAQRKTFLCVTLLPRGNFLPGSQDR